MIKVFVSPVRPLTEYACQVWRPGITGEQEELLESIQERALKVIYPGLQYEEACREADLPTLKSRRDDLCKRLFVASQSSTATATTCFLPRDQQDMITAGQGSIPYQRSRQTDLRTVFCLSAYLILISLS